VGFLDKLEMTRGDMAKFNYKARTKGGELQVGTVDANSRDAALQVLLNNGLFVLGVAEIERENIIDRIAGYLRRVKPQDLMIFTRQFATLIASRVPLSEALTGLYRQTRSPILKEAIVEISKDVDAGLALSQALRKHKGIFSEFYVNMVQSSEVTGRMAEVLDFLADYLESQAELIARVRNALAYPVIVLVLFGGVIAVLVTFVLPQITPIFAEANVDLPLFTRLMIGTGDFVNSWWWAVLIIVALFALMIVDYTQTPEGKVVRDEMVLRVPILGSLFQKLYIARFAESAQVLIKGGLTIPQAIEISSHTIGNTVYKELLHRAGDQVRKGRLLSEALVEMKQFPPLISQLIGVGESTGRLEELLEKVRQFYTRELDDMVGNLVNLLQPILMVGIGIVVAIMFASILLPLYDLTQTF
jgi:type II secretory pathway component PulF